MIKACIFDLDGTLLYTLPAVARAGNAALAAFSYPPQPVEDYRYYCGEGAEELVRRLMQKVGDEDPAHFAKMCRVNRASLRENPTGGVRVYEGMPETLAALKAKGLSLAVCSNKPNGAAQETIAAFFGQTFDFVQGQTEELPRKPDPATALLAARACAVSPSECLYIGDSGTDMKTGNAAGMRTVGALWGYRPKEELLANGAQVLLKEPRDILSLLLRTERKDSSVREEKTGL